MIMDTIIKIRHYIDTNTLKNHENDQEVIEMATTQTKLYKMITQPDCDLAMLQQFIILQEQIQNGKLKSEDADKQFGEVAAKRYVYPLVDK